MILKIIGVLLIGFGLVDLLGSFAQFDLWGTLGIQLPDIIWKFSAYIEIALGYFLFSIGGAEESEGEIEE